MQQHPKGEASHRHNLFYHPQIKQHNNLQRDEAENRLQKIISYKRQLSQKVMVSPRGSDSPLWQHHKQLFIRGKGNAFTAPLDNFVN